jgi:hypothetical protein
MVSESPEGAKPMSESEAEEEPTRGPRGGRKHQPGRGHDRKSVPEKKKRFAEKAARKRNILEEDAKRLWNEWDELPDEVKKLLGPAGEPRVRRPSDES